MSRNKAGVCACGHEIGYWHDEGGRCTYGAGSHGEPTAKRCPCQRKASKGNKSALGQVGAGGSVAEVATALRTAGRALHQAADAFAAIGLRYDPEPRGLRAWPETLDAPANGVAHAHDASPATPAASAEGHVENDWLRGGRRAVLLAIAQRGDRGASHAWIAMQTGYKPTSRRTYLAALSSKAYIARWPHRGSDEYHATGLGLEALGPFEALPTGKALIDHWLGKLPESEATIFNQVVVHGECSTAVIEEQTGYKSTSVRTYLNKLAARSLLTTRKGIVRLSDELR
jgi:hypothetical protein